MGQAVPTPCQSRDAAAALLAAFDAGDREAVEAVVIAGCHAEDAYHVALRSGNRDAARVAMVRAFLGSLAVGSPKVRA